ncbi:cell surface hyaluronidase-like isoform X2 [Ptychodera flava]|uniref:cell surface hyaluronidase-like isoform X2 n=1 Tax=Ptychodera flava TaxID=63121 RepID=UPI00396AA2B3
MIVRFSAVAFLMSILYSRGKATCPHLDPELLPWSNETTWGAAFRIPVAGKSVLIDQPILLDTTPPPLLSLVITHEGRLVWSDEGDYELTTGNIKIEGELTIGSPTCKFEHKARITLTGKSDDPGVPEDCEFGRKFIGVGHGGSLNLHGKDKLSWTKLNRTAHKMTLDTGMLYDHRSTEYGATRTKGLYVTSWYPNGTLFAFGIFKTSEQQSIEREKTKFVNFLEAIPEGYVVAIAIRREFARVPGADYGPIFAATEDIASIPRGASKLRKTRTFDAYALLAVKGQNQYTLETRDVNDGSKRQRTAGFIGRNVNGLTYQVRTVIDTTGGNQDSIDFYVMTKEAACPKISAIDDLTSWNAGDTVVFTSTDYDMDQVEERYVYPCFDCEPNEIRVDHHFLHTHFGEMADGVDERGEVALLSRNIVISGQMENRCYGENKCEFFEEDTFGGHVKISSSYGKAHIEGVEFTDMGQQATEGRNPIHFGMLGDVGCKAYFTKNSIHHSYSRCVNIRGTFGLLVEDNVGYDVMGHCYYLSDGIETDNVLDGNIGINIHYSTLLPTERSCDWHRSIFRKNARGDTPGCGESEGASAFWIAHPNNAVRNNVAAGSVNAGFWYPLFEEAVGESKNRFPVPIKASLHTVVTEFTNNVAHSAQIGFKMDNRIKTSESTEDRPEAYLAFMQNNRYEPWKDPDDPTSGRATSQFRKFTAYKNSKTNAFVRGGDITFTFSSFGDSPVGLSLVSSDTGLRQSSDCLFVGKSQNAGAPCTYGRGQDTVTFDRSLPSCGNPNTHFYGFEIRDGPNMINHALFVGYKSESWTIGSTSGLLPAGAIGFARQNMNAPKDVTMVTGLLFAFTDKVEGNRVYSPNENLNGYTNFGGDQLSSFYDIDGCTTGYADTTVVKNDPFLTSPLCYFHESWGMSVCPYHYSKLSVEINRNNAIYMVRDDAYEHKFSLNEVAWNQYLLMNDKSYTMHFNVKPPQYISLSFQFLYGHAGDFVRLGICFPKDTESFTFMDINTRTEVTSLEEVDADEIGTTYFWDSATGLLIFKVVSQFDPSGELFACTPSQCPAIRIGHSGGSGGVPDCYDTAYGPYIKEPETPSSKRDLMGALGKAGNESEVQDASSTVFGAGSSRPFSNRFIKIVGEGSADQNYILDGNWGAWTPWSECSNTCDGSRQRTRVCDNPPPKNGGLLCAGSDTEVEQCLGVVGCPVDGNWGEWLPWSDCSAECGGGVRNRTRLCDNPPAVYGGAPCEGAGEEIEPCNVEPCPTTSLPVDEVMVASHMNYSHLGCFVDSGRRDLPMLKLEDRFGMRPDFCVGHCVHYGFFYSAVQNGKFCSCGHYFGRYGEAPSSECDKPCTGDKSMTCGGTNRNDVYYTGLELPQATPCLDNTGVKLENKCFVYMSSPLRWYEAAQDCVLNRGNLVTILDDNQQAFLEYFTMTFGHDDYWIGLNDIEYEGEFRFADLTATELGSWDNFQEGYPLGNAETDDCVKMKSDAGYQWVDANCGSPNKYICEINVEYIYDSACGNRGEGISFYANCYLRLDDVGRWEDAVKQCNIRGGIPATIADSKTQAFISKYVALTGADSNWYFGLNDIEAEGNYTFMDGTPGGSYEAYCHDEPTNAEDEDCSMLVFKKNYLWEDVSCNSQGGVVCELRKYVGSPCSVGWTEYNGRCYLYVSTPSTYAEASEFCAIMEGATLATASTNAAQNFLYEFAVDQNTNLWIGLDDKAEEGKFVWQTDATEGSLMNWASKEPNSGEGNNCVMLVKSSGLWKAVNCESLSRFVCQVCL